MPSSKRDEPPRRVEILRRTSLARREFPPSDGREDTEKGVFVAIDRCRRLRAVSPRRSHTFRTTSPSNSHRFKVRPERRLVAPAPPTRNRLAPRAVARLRRAGARDRVFRFCREDDDDESFHAPSRRPATDPRRPFDSTDPPADGFQGWFHFLLPLRVCQRGSPRPARGPGA